MLRFDGVAVVSSVLLTHELVKVWRGCMDLMLCRNECVGAMNGCALCYDGFSMIVLGFVEIGLRMNFIAG